jgi:hypothetical protein
MGRTSGGVTREKGAGLNPGDILSTTSLISERERYQQEVDDTLTVLRDMYNQYGVTIDTEVADLKPGTGAMGFYDGTNIAINREYFDTDYMNKAYTEGVKSGWHPSNGNKSAMEAVVSHEFGHALTNEVGKVMGVSGIDNIATKIVNEAKKDSGNKGVVQMASKISRYATTSNAEAIAEAFSDVYCNGTKAKNESKAIINVINKYLKK